jgi:hypothetical protein
MVDVLEGVTAMLTNPGCPTIAVVDDDIEPDMAVMVTVPMVTLVASPFVPALLLITSTDGEDELQVTSEVRS